MSHCCVTSSARKRTRTGASGFSGSTSFPRIWRMITSVWRTSIAPTPTSARSAMARRRYLSRRPGTSPSVQLSNSSENTMTRAAVAT